MSRRHLSEIDIVEYADGEMPPARIEAAEEHLRGCDQCAETLSRARRTSVSVARLETLAAPRDLRQRVRAKLSADLAAALTCRGALPLLHEHVDRRLSPVTALRLERHLGSCAACRRHFAHLETTAELVRSLPAVLSPAAVRERVAAAGWATTGAGWRGPRLRPALATAGVVAVGALALLLRPGTQPLQVQERGQPVAVAQTPAAGVPAPDPAVVEAALTPAEVAESEAAQREREMTGPNAGVSPEPASRPLRQARTRRAPRSPEPAVALVAMDSALPLPGPVNAARKTSSVVPAAMQVLREVARSADYGAGAQQAMDQAAESFAILNSEDTLNSMPEFAAFSGPEKGPERPATAPPAPAGTEKKQPGRNSASTPDLGAPVTACQIV